MQSSKLPSRCGRGTRAFSLAEMIVVLTLIACLAGAVVVSLKDRDEMHKLNAAGQDLTAALRYAVANSQTLGRTHRVAFKDEWAQYRVEAARIDAPTEFEPARGLSGAWRPFPEGISVDKVLVDDIALDELPQWFEFPARTSAFHGSIALVDRLGDVMTVQVLPGTRQIVVAE
jgi:hypothetical protein